MIEIKNKRFYNGPGEYVGRPNPLGNPWTHLYSKYATKVESREKALELYMRWFYCDHSEDIPFTEELERLVALYKRRGHLILTCWCVPEKCHAEIIRDAILRTVYEK